MPRPVYQPEDALLGADIDLQNASLLDFWKWAFADLCDDDLKGIFAEWLVLRLLKIPGARRVSWANSDIITPDGVRVEIKSTSYWQSWKLMDETGAVRPTPLYPVSSKTQIRFAGLKARDAITVPNSIEPQVLKSHVYVFAFQHETDIERWNAMDLSQWEFYVLPSKRLHEFGWKSISLNMLRSQQAPLSATAFANAARKLIDDAAREIRADAASARL